MERKFQTSFAEYVVLILPSKGGMILNVVVFFSGGKESVFSLMKSLEKGFNIKCLLHVIYEFPRPSPHIENAHIVRIMSNILNIPVSFLKTKKGQEKNILKNYFSSLEIDAVVAGDLYIEEHRRWLSDICNEVNIKLIEPLWVGDANKSREILFEEVSSGIKTFICGVDLRYLDEKWLGFELNADTVHLFLLEIDKNIDPCGEMGEYHTLVFDCPLFDRKIEIKDYEIKRTENFAYTVIKDFSLKKK